MQTTRYHHQRKKRKVKDEPIILDQNFYINLLKMIQKAQYPYKINQQQLWQRDQALIAFLILVGTRNSETQKITKKQTHNYKTHILITTVKTLKKGETRDQITLPKKGALAPFTQIFETWLNQIPHDNNILFPTANTDGSLNWNQPLSRYRIHRIIRVTTNMFPHWLRGVHATIYAQQIFEKDPWALKQHMGWKNLDSTSAYVNPQIEKYTKNIYNLK